MSKGIRIFATIFVNCYVTFASDYAGICFNIEKKSTQMLTKVLSMTGYEKGKETFKLNIDKFDEFKEYICGNFAVMKLENKLRWRYMSPEEIFFEVSINRDGDMEMLENPQNYTGFDKYETFSFKTSGRLENRGNQAFYNLKLYANEFHNYGTIQTNHFKITNNYLFNSGVFKAGETPKSVANLLAEGMKKSTNKPKFRKKVIENYGKFISSKNTVDIRMGMSYYDYSESVFNNLRMNGGDIEVNGGFYVTGKVYGDLRNLKIADSGQCIINEFGIKKLLNFSIGKGAMMYSPNSFELNIDGDYENAGIIGAGGGISLYLKKIPQSRQAGLIMSGERFNYSYERKDLPKNHKDAPSMTSDPQMKSYLMAHDQDAKNPEFFKSTEYLRRQDDFYKRKGYKPEVDDKTVDALTNIGNTFAKAKKVTVYIDHYLNTITYHYTTYQPSGNTVLTGVSETGYIFQSRERLEREIAGNMPPQLDDFLGKLKDILDKTKKLSDKQLRDTEARNKRERRLKLLDNLRNLNKIDDYQQFCNEFLHSGKLSGIQQQKLTELVELPSVKNTYYEMKKANSELVNIAETLEKLTINKTENFLKEMKKFIELRDSKVRMCLLYASKFRKTVKEWEKQNPLYADMAELVMDGVGYTVAIVGTIATASALLSTAEVSVPATIALGLIIYSKNYGIDECKKVLINRSAEYGINEQEAQEFKETTKWVIEQAQNVINLGKFRKTINQPIKPLSDMSNAYRGVLKIGKSGIASLNIYLASSKYKKEKSELLVDVLSEFRK